MICTECGQEFSPDPPDCGLCEDCYTAMENGEIEAESCPVCGHGMEWQECDGCEDGMIDEAEDDPINFAPGEEMTACQECHGHGGWLECPALPHTEEQMAEYRGKK